ncbi:MAG: hypothetical protein U5L11_06740 [Arhodomonas sp.]|nr:hypothetical protein [Arhodomonas sp.]
MILLVCERPTALPATVRSRAIGSPDRPRRRLRATLARRRPCRRRLPRRPAGRPCGPWRWRRGEGLAQYRRLIGQLHALYRSELSPTVAAAQWQGMDCSTFVELLQMATGEIARRAATGAGHGPEVEGLSELAAWG